MSWLDRFFAKGYVTVQSGGSALPTETIINFASGATVADDPSNGRTNVTVSGGGATPGGSTGAVQTNNGSGGLGGINPGTVDQTIVSNGTTWAAGALNLAGANATTGLLDGSKVNPGFGAQNISATGVLSIGSTPANAGAFRIPNASQVKGRNPGNTANITLIEFDASSALWLGSTSSLTETASSVGIYPSGNIAFGISGTTKFYVTASGTGAYGANNLGVYGSGGTFPDAGSGAGVFAMGNATTAPTTTPVGGGVLYSVAGALKWKGSSGTVTPIANADPHCPKCGTDVGVYGAENDVFGDDLLICRSCEMRTGNGVIRHLTDFFDRRTS